MRSRLQFYPRLVDVVFLLTLGILGKKNRVRRSNIPSIHRPQLQPTIVQLKEPSDLTLLKRMGSGLETGRSIWMNCRPNRNLEDPGPTALPNEIPAENRGRQRGGGGSSRSGGEFRIIGTGKEG
ncbi:hypothetical protein Bca4012_053184 [Brassica carinata]